MSRVVDLEGIRLARANLDSIARDHPHLVGVGSSTEEWEMVLSDALAGREVITLTEATELLKCHRETLRRAIRTKQLQAVRVGREYAVSKSDLEAYWQAKGGGKLFE